MTDEDYQDDEPEIEIRFEPDEDQLAEMGVSLDEFERQLEKAIENFHAILDSDIAEEEIPALDDIEIELQGQPYRLGDICAVHVEGDVDDLDGELDSDDSEDDSDDE